MKRQSLTLAALLAVALLALTACGSKKSSSGATTSEGSTDVSGKVSMVGVWTGDEQKHFQAVLDGFKQKYPNVNVTYRSTGDNTPTVLSTAVQGGNPPDLAAVSQPGLVNDFQKKGALKPMDFARDTVLANYPADIEKLGEINGNLYGLIIKAANKSTVWYNVKTYDDAGVKAGRRLEDSSATTARRSTRRACLHTRSAAPTAGRSPTSSRTSTSARPAPTKYDQLTKHQIKWTDPSVKKALTTMGEVLGDSENMVGGTSGALQTDFPTSVSNVFTTSPKGAQVIEGDFVPGVVASSNSLKPTTGYNVFAFPSVDGSGPTVVGGGDELMMFRDTPAIRALVTYLSTGEAQTIWAKLGGYSAPAKTVDASAYPDDITRTTATAIGKAKTFRFDLSDLQPASFGGTVGQGEFKIFQDFLKNPKNVDGIAAALESAAAKAYASGK